LDEAARFYRGELSRTLLLHIGAYSVILELLKPLFRNNLQGSPTLGSASDRGYILNELAFVYGELGRMEDALGIYANQLQLELEAENWKATIAVWSNLRVALLELGRRSEGVTALVLAREVAEAIDDGHCVTVAILYQMVDAVHQGRFPDAEASYDAFRQRPPPPIHVYRPGGAELWRCLSEFEQGTLNEMEWQAGYHLAVRSRNVIMQYSFLALRAHWDLRENRPVRALDTIEDALQITNKLGTPRPYFHDLRAWALAQVGRIFDAQAELQAGEQGLFAAEAYLALGEPEQARECALNAYRWAWGEGPPYIEWYYLERSRALLKQLGEPEPQLPPFDPSKVPPIPFEKEIRAAIDRLRAERAKETEDEDS